MSFAKLEGEMIRIKEDLGKAKEASREFGSLISEISFLKERALLNPATKKQLIAEVNQKEMLDLFASIQKDFDELKNQVAQSSAETEKVTEFIESLRTHKTFAFAGTESILSFLEKALTELDVSHVSITPAFIGLIDLSDMAVQLGAMKNNHGVIIEKERLSEALAFLLSKRMLTNIVFETDNAKITVKSINNVVVEADNEELRKLARLG